MRVKPETTSSRVLDAKVLRERLIIERVNIMLEQSEALNISADSETKYV